MKDPKLIGFLAVFTALSLGSAFYLCSRLAGPFAGEADLGPRVLAATLGLGLGLPATFALLPWSGGRSVDRLQTLAAGGEGPGNASEAEQAQLSRLAGRDLTVVADPPTASLVIRASPYVIDIVREVVALLDRRPRQIAIEVLVQEWLY